MRYKDVNDFHSIYANGLFPPDLDQPAFIYRDQQLSYRDVHARVEQAMANLVLLGVGVDSKVGYSLDNSPDAFILYMAIQRLDACAIPVFNLVPAPHKLGIWAACGAQIIVTQASGYAAVAQAMNEINYPARLATLDASPAPYCFLPTAVAPLPMPAPKPERTALMAMSSGTTGKPKVVAISQLNAVTVLKAAWHLMQPVDNGYSMVLAFPAATSGILTCLAMFGAGVRLIIAPDMSPASFLSTLDQHQADAIAAPPAFLEAITGDGTGPQYPSVERVYTGMDFFNNKLLHRMRQRFPNLTKAGNGYGLVETATVLMTWHAHSVAEFDRPTNRMTPVPDVGNEFSVRSASGEALAIGEQGELFIRGNSVVSGYIDNPQANAKAFIDGWFRTGDVAIAHCDASVTLLGRNKDIIKRGGRSISPLQVTEPVNQLTGVSTSAAIGVEHELYGQMLWLFVVSKQLDRGDVMRYCRENLPPYLVPDQITMIDQLPKNPGVGKLNYQALQAIAQKALAEPQQTKGGTHASELG